MCGELRPDSLYDGAGDDIIDGADISMEYYTSATENPDYTDDYLTFFDGTDLIMGGAGFVLPVLLLRFGKLPDQERETHLTQLFRSVRASFHELTGNSSIFLKMVLWRELSWS